MRPILSRCPVLPLSPTNCVMRCVVLSMITIKELSSPEFPVEKKALNSELSGAIQHPQVNNDSVNYSKAPWAAQPTQMISYVSCHDDMCLVDRLKSSIPDITPEQLARAR